MALYDHRVFRVGPEWWVAQVHSAAGAGYSPRSSMTVERVLFRSLDDDTKGRTNTIPPGMLNRLSYAAMERILAKAEPMQHGLSMHPFNAPPGDEFRHRTPYTDAEGLRWVFRPTRAVRAGPGGVDTRPAIEVICLDDSALRKEVLLQDDSTYTDAKQFAIADIDEGLVQAVKATFAPYPADFYDEWDEADQ